MLYVLDNGLEYADRALLFVEVPLDRVNKVKLERIFTELKSFTILLCAPDVEWRDQGAMGTLGSFVRPSDLFDRVRPASPDWADAPYRTRPIRRRDAGLDDFLHELVDEVSPGKGELRYVRSPIWEHLTVSMLQLLLEEWVQYATVPGSLDQWCVTEAQRILSSPEVELYFGNSTYMSGGVTRYDMLVRED